MRIRWACLAAALGVGIAACSGDLFHSTDWTTICASQPNTKGCPDASAGVGGAGGSGGSVASGAGGNAVDAGDGGDAGPPPDCATYCGLVTSACDDAGPDGGATGYQQYTSLDECMGVCAHLSLGPQIGGAADTVGCRQLWATKAKGANIAVNCLNAGPSGGDKCGAYCDVYCDMMTAVCAGTYVTQDACMTSCKTFATDVAYSTASTKGDEIGCHLYYAVEAVADPMQNCPLAGSTSTQCK